MGQEIVTMANTQSVEMLSSTIGGNNANSTGTFIPTSRSVRHGLTPPIPCPLCSRSSLGTLPQSCPREDARVLEPALHPPWNDLLAQGPTLLARSTSPAYTM